MLKCIEVINERSSVYVDPTRTVVEIMNSIEKRTFKRLTKRVYKQYKDQMENLAFHFTGGWIYDNKINNTHYSLGCCVLEYNTQIKGE